MNANTGLTPTDLISEYIQLRDGKAKEVDEHKAYIAERYDQRMRAIESTLLNLFTALGVDNLSAHGIGTAYKKTSVSVTTADASEFRRHVIGSEEWDLVSWIPSKTAVNERVERGEPIPPGVNRSAFLTIGIRRS
jgi:hypothetical protein